MATKTTNTKTTPEQTAAAAAPETLAPEAIFINVPVPTDLHRRLRVRAINDGTSMKDAVVAALDAWVDSA